MKNTLALIPLIICFSLLTGYNFMAAQWSAPTATAPGDNTDAPINTGLTTQNKGITQISTTSVATNIFAAFTEMRSNRYCDSLGANCVSSSGMGGLTVQVFPYIAPNTNIGSWDFCALTQNRFNDDKAGSMTPGEGCLLSRLSDGTWSMWHNGFSGNGCSAACFSM